jgi:tetratricopeptide (TPR) repeat protein
MCALTRYFRSFIAIAACAALYPVHRTAAQVPPGSSTISAPAAAESLKVLDQLARTTKLNPKNADAWYRRGMIAFALAERTWEKDTIPFLNYRQLRLSAADALLAAVNLDPKNRTFILALSQFHLTDRTGIGHSAARIGLLDDDADLTKADPDTVWRVQRLLDAGWIAWLDYDGYANRAMSKFVEEAPSLESVIKGKRTAIGPAPGTRNIMPGPPDASPFSVRTAASMQQIPGSPPDIDLLPISSVMMGAIDSVKAVLSTMSFEAAGEADYLRAEQRFRAAYTLAPANNRAYRCFAMLLAERDNWTELQKLARDHTQRVPEDGWG